MQAMIASKYRITRNFHGHLIFTLTVVNQTLQISDPMKIFLTREQRFNIALITLKKW